MGKLQSDNNTMMEAVNYVGFFNFKMGWNCLILIKVISLKIEHYLAMF